MKKNPCILHHIIKSYNTKIIHKFLAKSNTNSPDLVSVQSTGEGFEDHTENELPKNFSRILPKDGNDWVAANEFLMKTPNGKR